MNIFNYLFLFFAALLFLGTATSADALTCVDPLEGCESIEQGDVCRGETRDEDISDIQDCDQVCVLDENGIYQPFYRIQAGGNEYKELGDLESCNDLNPPSSDDEFTVNLTFVYSNSDPVSNLPVTIDEITQTTATNGLVIFTLNESENEFPLDVNWSLDQIENLDSCITEHRLTDGEFNKTIDLECSPDGAEVPDEGDGDVELPPVDDGDNEECECTGGNPSDFQGQTCSDFSDFEGGNLICDNNCNIITDQCYSCPTQAQAESGACADSANPNICEECEECANSAYCSNYCTSDFEFTNLAANRVSGELALELAWDLPNFCTVNDIDIYRCSGDAPECANFEFYAQGSSSSVGFKDSNIELNTSYCYRVDMQIQEDISNTQTYNDTECIRSADAACTNFGEGEPVCHDGDVIECQDGVISNQESCDNACIYDEDGAPFCSDSPVECDIGSGPFGSFGYLSDHILANEVNGCYFDHFSYEFSNVGSLDECSEVTSCYDYFAKSSCESNDCNVPLDCEWNDYVEEFSLGACMPQDNQYVNCNECDENMMGTCTKDMCESFYGNSSDEDSLCFYNSEPEPTNAPSPNVANVNMCSNVGEVACETYNSRVECEGSGSKFTINTPNFDDLSDSIEIAAYNNSVVSYSDDALGLSKCVWESSRDRCVRDAAGQRDKYERSDFDCDNNDLDCLTDFENPKTTFTLSNGEALENGMLVSKGMLRNGVFNVSDNVYSIDETDVYFSYEKNNYPIEKVVNQKLPTPITLNEGNASLNFFSIDFAKNTEEVKSIDFEIAPSLGLDLDLQKDTFFRESDNLFYTNLTGVVTSQNSGLTLEQCDVELNIIQDEGESRFRSGNAFEFTNVADGLYRLTVDCIDNLGQTASIPKDLQLIGDDLIVPQSPMFTTKDTDNVEISLLTGEPAEKCQIRRVISSNEYGEWINMNSGADKSQNSFVTTLNYNESNILRYDTRCQFDPEDSDIDIDAARLDENNWFNGKLPHSFIFAVDADSPELKVIDTSTNEEFEIIEDRSAVQLRFVCDWSKEDERWEEYGFGAKCPNFRVCSYDETSGSTSCSFNDENLVVDESASSHGETHFETKNFVLDNDRSYEFQNWFVKVETENEFGRKDSDTLELGLVDYSLPGAPVVVIS